MNTYLNNLRVFLMVHYTISPSPKQHLWHISLRFTHHTATPLVFSLPNWVPGSYMIRDFAKNVVSIQAQCQNQVLPLQMVSKNRWQIIHAPLGEYCVEYQIYAFDLSVRSSFLDTQRGFFDGACMFLNVEHLAHTNHTVHFTQLPDDWQIATTLPSATTPYSFQAPNYASLIDHPVELGKLETLTFIADGITHRIVLSGHYGAFNQQRLLDDCQDICETVLAMFPKPAPFTEYLFLLHLGHQIYGGLEHISSTALHADRNCLPPLDMKEANDAYTQLLGLIAHEYFHAWNVKSIKPTAFTPYQLDKESYTEQLWAFEGITSYYDDLILVRSGVITPQNYLSLLAKNITRVQQGFGRQRQTLAESSLTAWHKYYKQDENSPNAIVSYYQKGALMALCLDLLIRQRSQNQYSLDHVMHSLYQQYLADGKGIDEQQWQQLCQTITGIALDDFFHQALYTTADLPLAECLANIGIQLDWQSQPFSHGGGLAQNNTPNPCPATDFGAKFRQDADGITLTHVFTHGSAEQAGLSPQDKIIAINRFSCTHFAVQWQSYRIGETLHIHYFRHGVLHETSLTVQAAPAHTAILSIQHPEQLQQSKWLTT